MTIFVTEPTKRGNRMLKPQPLPERYEQSGEMLNWLIAQHPDAIYFTDDVDGFMGPITVSGDRLKMMLASRLTVASTAADAAREMDPFTAKEYATVARLVAESLAVIRELERMWESLFDYVPSLGEVSEWSVKANLTGGV